MGLLNLIKSFRKQSLKVLILGLDNSGKTTLLTNLVSGDITTIQPTRGFNVKQISVNGYDITAWDIGGQDSIRSHWRNYYSTTDVLIYVIDSSDLRRLEESGRELRGVLDQIRVPILILANKQDLVTALDGHEVFVFLK